VSSEAAPLTSIFAGVGASAQAPGRAPSISSSVTEGQPASFRTLTEFAKANQSKLQEVLTHDRQIVFEIHDVFKAYYSTSVQHYTDMVCKNSLNEAFMNETMDIFSDKFLDQLPDSLVSKIAAESVADRKARRELNEDIERLEEAISQSEAILNEPNSV